MRNRLTSNEKIELGLFLGVAAFLCVVLAAVMQVRSLPALNAVQPVSVKPLPGAAESVIPEPIAFDPAPTLELPDFLPTPSALEKQFIKPKTVAPEIKRFGGKDFRFVKTLRLRVTAYAPDPRCTYPYDGTTTASGMSVKTNGGKLVAADTSLIPLHSVVSVPGYAGNATVPVLDRGGAIKGYRLDVLLPTYEAAQKWGSRMLEVKVYAPVK
ncbi:MAG TPA: 3D domain-containing protein [Phycisphaerae bacterium]|nr:3D domain-containing protein [Phycisphaerae bacterium]